MQLIEGIRIVNDDIVFDFKEDLPTDLISLKFQKFNKKLSTRFGTNIYFGYRYNEGVDPNDLALVRDAIKMLKPSINENNINLLVSKAVNNFLNVANVNFDIIITPKSSSPLVNKMATFFKQKLGQNTILATDLIVKNSIENVKIDPVKLKGMDPSQEKNVLSALKSATKSGSFKMKSIPIPMRRIIIDFMKFKDDASREIFNRINNGNVLLIDDIYTGGSTFNEMTRIISQHNSNSITGFVLLLSK